MPEPDSDLEGEMEKAAMDQRSELNEKIKSGVEHNVASAQDIELRSGSALV
jgi:hypothetical protein